VEMRRIQPVQEIEKPPEHLSRGPGVIVIHGSDLRTNQYPVLLVVRSLKQRLSASAARRCAASSMTGRSWPGRCRSWSERGSRLPLPPGKRLGRWMRSAGVAGCRSGWARSRLAWCGPIRGRPDGHRWAVGLRLAAIGLPVIHG
jgi:hypothetical protein